MEEKCIDQLNFARCYNHLLKNRCKCNSVGLATLNGKYYMKYDNVVLELQYHRDERTYFVNVRDHPEILLLILNEEHMLGLNNPCLLFIVVKRLENLMVITGKNLKIENNEIQICGSDENMLTNFEKSFENIILAFNKSAVGKVFKLQLGLDNCLVLNRRLKISLSALEILLKTNEQKVVDELVELALWYFKCFSIPPVCCRMQSIAQEAVVYDFEKFTYLHIHTYLPLYIKMCKILYPFIVNVDEEILKQVYLEILPVSLIQRFHGDKIEMFNKLLLELHEMKIDITPLANGNFRVGKYLNFTPDMLCKIVNLKMLKSILDEIEQLIDEHSLLILRQEDCENGYAKNAFVHYVKFSTELNAKIFIQYYPVCVEPLKNRKSFCIVICEHYMIFAFEMKNIDDDVSSIVAKTEPLCQNFLQIFSETASSLLYALPQKCFDSFKSRDVKFFKIQFSENDVSEMHSRKDEEHLPVSDLGHGHFIYTKQFFGLMKHMGLDKSDLESYIWSEGLCLAFVKNKIDTVENVDIMKREMNPDYYKATADYCYYNQNDLKKFLEIVENPPKDIQFCLKNLEFEITQYGLIRFLDRIEISPSTLLLIKHKKELLQFINKSSFLDHFQSAQVPLNLINQKSTQTSLIEVAKAFNPRLEVLRDSCFNLPNFRCIPRSLLEKKEANELIKTLLMIRKNNIKIKAYDNFQKVILDRCCFDIDIFHHAFAVVTLMKLLIKLEEINALVDNGYVLITGDSCFTIFEYEYLESEYYDERGANKDCIKRCFEILPEYSIQDVVVVQNKALLINQAIAIRIQDMAKWNTMIYNTFFEASEYCKIFHNEVHKTFLDNLISISADNETSETLGKIEKFSYFRIIEDKKKTYFKLAASVNDIFRAVPRENRKILLSKKWLRAVPRELLMDKENASKLLSTFENIKGSHSIWVNNDGSISVENVQLSLTRWLQIRDQELFCKFIDICKNFITDDQSKIQTWHLNANGSYSFDNDKTEKALDSPVEVLKFILHMFQIMNIKTRFLEIKFRHPFVEKIKEWEKSKATFLPFTLNSSAKLVQDTLEKIERKKDRRHFLPITLNSGSNFMIGNFIWSDIEETSDVKEEFLNVVKIFEEAVYIEDKELMKSIYDLSKKSRKDKENAIELVLKINKNLEHLAKAEEVICNKMLRIIPADLWKKCNNDPLTYEKTINIFNILDDNKITWLIKLNGNVAINERLTVTVTDLLDFYCNIQSSKTSIISLKNLLQEIVKNSNFYLTCKEEIEHNHDKQLFMPKISSYEKMKETFAKLKRETKFKELRVEPNGTLLFKNHIWIKSDDPYVNEIPRISDLVYEIFPNNKFQIGHPKTSVLISILTDPAHRLYQYCYNMCKLVQELYSDMTIKYQPENDLFKFNEVLSIHSRSFFHLQNMDKVVDVIRELSKLKQMWENFDALNQRCSKKEIAQNKLKLQNEEIRIYQKLWEIKKQERLEFDLLKEKVYERLNEICSNSEELKLTYEKYGNVKDIQVQGEYIFRNGSTLGFINKKETGAIKYEYKDKHIIKAVLMAEKLQEPFKCKNLFDFQSLIEIVSTYPSFKTIEFIEMHEVTQLKSESDQINFWLKEVQKEQEDKGRKHKFTNTLKGLHHWVKHPHGFKNLNDYYNKMNQFFDSTNHGLVLDTQNGEFLSQHYENDKYTGYYRISHDDSNKKNYVATFFTKKKTQSKKVKTENLQHLCFKKENPAATCLVITDTDFKNFKADFEIHLDEKIIVKTFSKPRSNYRVLIECINNSAFNNVSNIKKTLFFLSETPKNKIFERISVKEKNGKGKKIVDGDEIDYATCFQEFLTHIQQKFNSCSFLLCYSHKTNPEYVEIMIDSKPQNFQLVEINRLLMTELNASKLKNFIELQLNIYSDGSDE